ncbi:MAG TPA: NADH-quinone oxidoreductase subunit NuoH [Gemmatimonadaceae bacterium]|nr:NADH-quinone oxidoreductase subunit NuoH [Gemmatimonadaceae bacterium]
MSSWLVLTLLQAANPQLPPASTSVFVIATVIKMIVVFTILMVGVALLTLAERKISAWIQDRHGPNRVGPHGLLQPAADGLKNIMKEETYPEKANIALFVLAPAIAFIPAMLTFAVIPFASPLPLPGVGLIEMVVAPLPIGFLYILALTSLGVYGIVLAGWASNNKYSLLGGLRSSAQMVSYEIAMGLSTVAVLLVAGNVALNDIIWQQATTVWNFFGLTIAFLIFLIAAFAETNRLPFDLPEAESELIAGYHTEYSAMKFSLFFIAEYSNMVTASALLVTLFFGGWDIPFTLWDNMAPWSVWKTVLTGLVFAGKVLFFLFFYMWIRWTLPRFRYDQLMSLGWRVLLPISLAYIVLIATALLILDLLGIRPGAMHGTILGVVNLAAAGVLFLVLDSGRVISPASRRVREDELRRLRARRERSPLAVPGGGD